MRTSRAVHAAVLAAVALVVLISAAPAVRAADDFAPVAGKWSGYVEFPSGASDPTMWTFDNTGRYSVQWGAFTVEGTLVPSGDGYKYAFEYAGQPYSGTIAAKTATGGPVLVGTGRDPTGPVNFTLRRSGA